MGGAEPETPVANLLGAPLSPVVGSSPTPSESGTSETRKCSQVPTALEYHSGSEMNMDAHDEKSFGSSASSATPGTGSSENLLNGAVLDQISLELSDVGQQLKAKDLLSEYFGMKFDTLHHAIQHLEASPLAEARLKALYHKFTRHFNLPGQLIVPSLRLCKETLHLD